MARRSKRSAPPPKDTEPEEPPLRSASVVSSASTEADDDPGLAESLTYMRLLKDIKKSGNVKDLVRAEKEMIGKKDGVLEDMRDGKEKSERADDIYRESMYKMISESLPSNILTARIQRSKRLSQIYTTATPRHPYAQYNDILLASCHQVLEETESLDKLTPAESLEEEKQTLERWKDEREKVELLIRGGRKQAGKVAGEIMGFHERKEQEERDGQGKRDGQEEREVREEVGYEGVEIDVAKFFEKKSVAQGKPTLGKTLEYAERGFRKMAKGLPDEVRDERSEETRKGPRRVRKSKS